MNNWRTYQNGNVLTSINLDDGTLVRQTQDEEFHPAFASNIDIKITNKCDIGCRYCHEGSCPEGEHGDIMHLKLFDTLHPYQEIALGGGNVLTHPDLIPFLKKMQEIKAIPNITVNQRHFEQGQELISYLVEKKLIYGLGVSLGNPTSEFISLVKKYPNTVIHVINGIFSEDDYKKLRGNDLKLLVLGYKKLRRGEENYKKFEDEVQKKMQCLSLNLEKIIKSTDFKIISFDNLAIEQLKLRRLLSDEFWEIFYAGDEGTTTYYIDTVEEKFAESSVAPLNERFPLMKDVDSMFSFIRRQRDGSRWE